MSADGVDSYQLSSGCGRPCALYCRPQGRDPGVLAAVQRLRVPTGQSFTTARLDALPLVPHTRVGGCARMTWQASAHRACCQPVAQLPSITADKVPEPPAEPRLRAQHGLSAAGRHSGLRHDVAAAGKRCAGGLAARLRAASHGGVLVPSEALHLRHTTGYPGVVIVKLAAVAMPFPLSKMWTTRHAAMQRHVTRTCVHPLADGSFLRR